ncbi:MAG TPA: hypothetical protein VFS15_14145, partial [Kofleriaceae bacterium]|nr:hypothetical protein [Kofleriaceae bacterium]
MLALGPVQRRVVVGRVRLVIVGVAGLALARAALVRPDRLFRVLEVVELLAQLGDILHEQLERVAAEPLEVHEVRLEHGERLLEQRAPILGVHERAELLIAAVDRGLQRLERAQLAAIEIEVIDDEVLARQDPVHRSGDHVRAAAIALDLAPTFEIEELLLVFGDQVALALPVLGAL